MQIGAAQVGRGSRASRQDGEPLATTHIRPQAPGFEVWT